jgi:hypothetical protein
MLMASQEMIDAGFGGLAVWGPWYNVQSPGQVGNTLFMAIQAWNPGSAIAYMADL